MNNSLRFVLFIALVLYFFCIFSLLKKKRFSLKYALLWLASGLIMILILIFPNVFGGLMHAIGIVEMTNGLFAVVLFAVIIILISITSIVTKLNESIRQLTQQCAMYEKRIRDLEESAQNENTISKDSEETL